MVGQETEKPEWIAPPRLGRHFKCEVTSGFREEVRTAAHAVADETGEEALGQPADNRQHGHGRTAEGSPKGLAAGDGSIRGVLNSTARTVHNEKPIPGPDADRVDFASPVRVPSEVFDRVAFLVDVEVKERKAGVPNIVMDEISSRDMRNAKVLRERDAVAGGRHDRSPEGQPYGYPFLSLYPLPV